MDALILAGGREKSFARELPADAAFSIDGRSMLDRVVDAIAATGRFSRILVVGGREALSPDSQERITAFVEPKATLTENLMAGLRALGGDDPVLIAASDIPLLSPGAVEGFIGQCEARPGADIYYPVIPERVFSGASGPIHRTFLRLKDGVFTGGNMLLTRPRLLLDHEEQVGLIIENRKNPLQWGKLLGWSFFVKASTVGVSLDEIERKLAEAFKIRGSAVRCESLGIGLDADSDEDLDWIRFYWGLEKKNGYSDDLTRTITLVESVRKRLESGEIESAEIRIALRPGQPFVISTETSPADNSHAP